MKVIIKNILKKVIPFAVTRNQKYDRDTKLILSRILRKNSNTVDVGCHKGEVLELLIKIAPQGKHFGIEPIPFLAQQLRDKFKSNATILEFALNDKGEEVLEFILVKSNPAYSGLKEREYKKEEELEKIKVNTARLDKVIPSDVKIDFIKIDVEGGELGVILGSESILIKDKPVIIFEHGLGAADKYGTKPEMIFDLLEQHRYSLSLLKDFLKTKRKLNKKDFTDEYLSGRNYYFIAW